MSIEKRNILLVEVQNTEYHAFVLYGLLAKRTRGISHTAMPTWEAHQQFVAAHPYRHWYLIQQEEQWMGTVYLSLENSIGISLTDMDEHVLQTVLTTIQHLHRPLPAIASVRNACFHVNVCPDNQVLIQALQGMGAWHLQSTYQLPQP